MRLLAKWLSTFLLSFFICFSLTSASLAETSARATLEGSISSILHELQNPKLHSSHGRKEVITHVEDIVHNFFDFEELSARTTGAAWRSFTPDQKQRFTEALTTLLRETYLEKIDNYEGEGVEYKSEVSSSDGKRVEIQTTISFKDKPVSVAYRLIKKKQWVVYDVIIEGVGMVQNYRKQFQDMLAKGKIEPLITLIQKKAIEAKEHREKELLAK